MTEHPQVLVILALIAAAACSINRHQEPKATPSEGLRDTESAVRPSQNAMATGVKRRLFADDVPMESLALSISIETLGGVSTVLIPRGTPLPAEKREIFSTGADNQISVEVHVLQGERSLAKDNRTLGKFHLANIPPAARGVPQIEVVFAVDANGVLDVSAKDLATGTSQKITITASSSEVLSKAEIDKMVREAEAHQDQDQDHRDWSAARDDLDTLIYSTGKLLAESGARLPQALKERCERQLKSARSVLTNNSEPGAAAPLTAAHAALQSATHAVSEFLYKK